MSRRKPVVALKGGRRSVSGLRGARSHTAAQAGDVGVVDALFAHTGVIRARTMEELIDVGLLLDRQPAPGVGASPSSATPAVRWSSVPTPPTPPAPRSRH